MKARHNVATLKALLRQKLEESVYFQTDKQGNRELYFSPVNSRDITVYRLLNLEAKTVEAFISILIAEYNGIIISGNTFFGRFFDATNEDSTLAKILKDCIDIATNPLEIKLQAPTSSYEGFDEILPDHAPIDIEFKSRWKKIYKECSEHLTAYISSVECSVDYKLERLLNLDLHFNRFKIAEELYRLLLTCESIEALSELLVILDEKIFQLSTHPEEMHSDLIPLITTIKNKITKQFMGEFIKQYRDHLPHCDLFRTPINELLTYLTEEEKKSNANTHNIEIAMDFITTLFDCQKPEDLEEQKNNIFSIWAQLFQANQDCPLAKIISTIGESVGTQKAVFVATHPLTYPSKNRSTLRFTK